jgi:predicted Zn-dependent protease
MTNLTRKMMLLLVGMIAIAAIGWFGRKAYRQYTARHFVAQSREDMKKGNWRDAGMCLQRALQVNPMSAEVADALGDFLEDQSFPGALTWRIRSAQLAPGEAKYRLSWAKTAIKLQELADAKTALEGLSRKDKESAEYHKLAGALAWELRDATEATRQYTEALKCEPANLAVVMNLATIDLASTNDSVAAAGRSQLQQLTTNAEVRIAALKQLTAAAISRKSFPEAIGFARKAAESPGASFGDRLDYLQVLRTSRDTDYTIYLHAIERDAATNSLQAAALGEWLSLAENPTNALVWLQSLPPNVQTNPPVPMGIANCLAAVKDWPALLALVSQQDWGEANYYRLALESLAHSSLKEDIAAKSAWQKAVNLSKQRLDRLSRLAQLGNAWNRPVERVEVLRELTTEFPKERWAAGLLVDQYYKEGNTRALLELLTMIYTADPGDPKLKSGLAIASLLRKSDVERAHRLAFEAYEAAPDNPFFASTYAYSLLLQQRADEAARIVSEVKTNFLQIPTVAAYYGVVQVRSGHKELAREPLKLAEKSALLPEEKELVQLAQSQL